MSHIRRISARHIINSGYLDPKWFAIIISGVVKLVKAQPDGRQQIVGLLFPSDFLGRPYSPNSSLIIEAVTDLEVCCFPRAAFEDLMREYPSLEQAFLKRTLDELDASREWMFVLGRKTAQERVASLLLLITDQITQAQPGTKAARSSLTFDLPLSRAELADCLGLTIETVTRQIRNMKSQRVLVTEGRRKVTITCLAALSAMAGGVV
jgi:CRP/FNR family transcriptional regulator